MCMTFNSNISKKFDKNGNFTAYKVFYYSYEEDQKGYFVQAMSFSKVIDGSIVARLKGDYYVSDRRSKNITRAEAAGDYVVVYKGIHVYLDKKQAEKVCNSSCRRLVPVVCNKKDLVAFGFQETFRRVFSQAVFLKVKIKHKKHRKLFLQMPRKKK